MYMRAFKGAITAAPRPAPFSSFRAPWVCATCRTRSRQFSFQPSTEASPTPNTPKPYYITTPIFYVNASPHVGHLYTTVLADVLKRWQQLKGNKAILCTGTDEHGMKVQKAAEKADVDPKLFCDKGADIFKELAQKAEIANDHFVRTTDPLHKDAVKYAWYLLKEKGYIYSGKHEGWYSVTDEAFYPESGVQLYLDPSTGRKMMVSSETLSQVEWTSEKNYHFRLSAFREPLLEFYKHNPDWIQPKSRMQEVVQAVESSLEDLSISRPSSRLTWGIRTPEDNSQTIYVWLDALMNYLTMAGYPFQPGSESVGGWPADCQVIGKDIVRFHCIYWPAFLMALGLPLPKRILTHAHWTLGGSKMSKSVGNVVDPFNALDRFSPDVMRFYLVHGGGIQQDANYDNVHILNLYRSFLHDDLGNLVSRVARGKKWSISGAVKRVRTLPAEEWEEGPGSRFYQNSLLGFPAKIKASMDACDPRQAAFEIVQFVRSGNQFFHASSPWAKILPFGPGEPGPDVDKIIFQAAEALRMAGILLQPYMPNKAKMLLDQLGVDESRRTLEYCSVGLDPEYGIPMIPIGSGHVGALFPPLVSEEGR